MPDDTVFRIELVDATGGRPAPAGEEGAPAVTPAPASRSVRDSAAATAGAGRAAVSGAPAGGGPGALALADAVASRLTRQIQTVGNTAAGAGLTGAMLARNQFGAAFGAAAGTAANAVEQIPVFGQVAGGIIRAGNALVQSFNLVTNAFIERGRELAKYSPELARAGAVAGVRSTLADIREAQALGGPLARLTDAQSRMETTIRDLLRPIKEVIVEQLASYLENAQKNITDIGQKLPSQDTIAAWGVALGTLGGGLGAIAANILLMLGIVKKGADALETLKKDPVKTLLDQFMNLDPRMPTVPRGPDPVGSDPGRLNLPLFQGF